MGDEDGSVNCRLATPKPVANRHAQALNHVKMSALPKRFFTPEEYLEFEVKAEDKSQYVAGEIFAMAGVKPAHDKIVGNLLAGLHLRFRGHSCDVFTSDMRMRAAAGDMYTCPDVTALCGEPNFEGKKNDPPSLLNPTVIFEVLSPSMEAFDRGEKFARYRRLETLRHYVLVSVDQMRVEHHRLRDDGVWVSDDLGETDEELQLASVDCELPLAEIYERVKLPV